MPNKELWRAMGAKELMQFLTSATGEQHDVAVYDTGYEFDPYSEEALRFIAGIAMTKASHDHTVFETAMPQDGSVAAKDVMPENERMRKFAEDRKRREHSAQTFYVPDSSEYCNYVSSALHYRQISCNDMTPEERQKWEAEMLDSRRADNRYVFIHLWLPIGALAIFALYGLFKLLSLLL